MAGDTKGKGKQVVQKKKRSRDDQEWERALAAADATDMAQRSVWIRGDGEGEPDSEPSLRRSGRRRQTEASQPPQTTRSGPRTRGGGTQRAESRANQGR